MAIDRWSTSNRGASRGAARVARLGARDVARRASPRGRNSLRCALPRCAPVRDQCVVSGPSSWTTFCSGLYTNRSPAPLPPHRMPWSCTLVPEVTAKTSEPLSPPPTPAATKFWHSSTMRLPDTPVLTHFWVTWPAVQPVVRPTLLTVAPTATALVASSLVIVKLPVTVSEPLFGADVAAIRPSAWFAPLTYAARDESLRRHSRFFGQPAP